MRKTFCLITFVVLAMIAGPARGQQRIGRERQYSVEERETVRRTLEFSATGGHKLLQVDGVFGAIHVTGYEGSQVEMIVHKNEYQGVRIGKGGPMLEFDGFNQDIRIRQAR